ncbi:alpha-1A adrenergic receptor-like, partial [Symsagittifera roscoffensis]|uniref:alpha-1A adrenergic receptor-like n=1 Tax=Symsagittifera roscoffensis TaxID=84072 RepID=UPI00307BB9E8
MVCESVNETSPENELSSAILKAGDYGSIAICLVSMLFGVTGSVYVSVRIIREPRLKSFRYFFVANQCVVDFCTTFFLAGSRLLHYYGFVGYVSRCRTLYMLYAIAEYVSPMILLLLSVERFVITVYPLHKDTFLRKKNYLGLVAFLWLTTALLTLGFIMGSEACQTTGEQYYCHLTLWGTDE